MFLLSAAASTLSQTRRESILQNVGFEPLHKMTPNEILIIAGIVIVGYMSIIVFAVLVKIICSNALEVGGCLFFKNNVEEESAKLTLIGEGFSDYAHVFVTLLLRDIFVVLWSCLGIFPGLVKGYSYRMVPYIVKDYPDLSETEVITLSRSMMDGNKWRLFCLDMSFIGWELLYLAPALLSGLMKDMFSLNGFVTAVLFSTIPVFIGQSILFPYQQTARAVFYRDLVGYEEDPAAMDTSEEVLPPSMY
jgi:uncharacterized membrane protein